MAQESGTGFIVRNRPPRVQIQYELFTGGALEMVKLPFVMGVLADLSGKPKDKDKVPSVRDRKFEDINVETLDKHMKSIKPRVAFTVPNVLTGEESLPIEIVFESMADFAPDAVARKVESLSKLLETREQLRRLLAYMDGKAPAEKLVSQLLTDKTLQAKLIEGMAKPEADEVATPAGSPPAA